MDPGKRRGPGDLDRSGRDLILLAGGLFLIAKATHEIHNKTDSIITAVGMARHVGVMVVAIVLAVGAMMLFAGAVSAFIDRHPTVKMLALSFLLLIGVMLVAEGFGKHIERGYIYFAMGFSLFVELLNLKVRRASGT